MICAARRATSGLMKGCWRVRASTAEQLGESLELEYRLSQCLQRYTTLKADNARLQQAVQDAEGALQGSEVRWLLALPYSVALSSFFACPPLNTTRQPSLYLGATSCWQPRTTHLGTAPLQALQVRLFLLPCLLCCLVVHLSCLVYTMLAY